MAKAWPPSTASLCKMVPDSSTSSQPLCTVAVA